MAGKILIFLDIDGVLLPFPNPPVSTCGAIFPDATLHALSQILNAVPDALLVLSSTWRAQKNMIDDIIESFQIYGNVHDSPLARITEFYDLTDTSYHDERQYEIYRYLQNNRPRAWIALEDEDLLLERYRNYFEGRAIAVSSPVGLTNADADLAIRLLQQQLAKS
ncbi:hypothetical protein FisN_23Hh227 [Fistulifera solaris]|uniref:FCP1 homology domain-containing protein n=1 Tax=Fistulifera solaris TaxID=1519565 RepID=A0A1Z5JWB8_FISSO|nr:hypothetical protein FisN_23Hh227 [Fistulifera solaris]|eukprot:GAX18333.1 hypothetical protein FisN_23Hh227 [Fistulifera solaris]